MVTTSASHPLRSAGRLQRGSDIRAVFARRCSAAASTMVIHARNRADDSPARVAVIAGRKVGGAVVRNRVKRRLRAALQARPLPQGVDLVVVARPAAAVAPFAQLRSELDRLVDVAVGRCRR